MPEELQQNPTVSRRQCSKLQRERKQWKKEATNLAKWARLATTTLGRCSLCLILCEPEEAEEPKRRWCAVLPSTGRTCRSWLGHEPDLRVAQGYTNKQTNKQTQSTRLGLVTKALRDPFTLTHEIQYIVISPQKKWFEKKIILTVLNVQATHRAPKYEILLSSLSAYSMIFF